MIIAHYSFHCLPFTRKKRFLHIIFWIILVSFCWVCISLLTREREHPQWDTVSHCGLQFDLLDTLLLMLRVWFVLFTGRAFCWLLSSLASACPFHKASPQQLLFECQGLAQPSAEHHTSLILTTFFCYLCLQVYQGPVSVRLCLLFSVSITPNFPASSKLLRIYSILLFRPLILLLLANSCLMVTNQDIDW